MSVTPAASIVFFSAGDVSADVRAALDEAGFAVSVQPLHEPSLANGRPQVFVVDGSEHPEQACRLLPPLRALQEEHFVPILFLTPDVAAPARLTSLQNGADTLVIRPFNPAELCAQVVALKRIKERHDELHARAAEVSRVNRRLQQAYAQIDQELILAKRIQESFLPQSLPQLPRVRFAVKYRPCGHVGGDFYDVFRLDEKHVGFYVADAMGHGVPASLLTIFVKKGVRAKEITDKSYRLVPPQEVLQRLNRDLIDQALSDTPFITMIYGLYNYADGTLQCARAGHPYPLYIPAQGPPRFWQAEGGLLGVYDTHYSVETRQLQVGDKLLLYTDGMDTAAWGQTHAVGLASFVAAAEHFRALPIGALVDRLAQDLFVQTEQSDDLTVLGLEVVE
jgi:sigma-B regulation protein RsbU (phosphoserine phosphatase)